ISTRDDAVRARTLDVMYALIEQCAVLGGRYLVHGSPHLVSFVQPNKPNNGLLDIHGHTQP
ncbi:MAG TPA: hypothetical protein VLL94_09250, partial [Nitrospiraceae bacterium]|nr:hypothetical protein [Nitrospiraceae bacterium]